MKKNLWLVFSVILLASMVLSACASPATPAPATQAPAAATQAPAAATQAPAAKHLKIGISTDAGYPARKIEVLGIYEGAKADGNEVIEQNADNDSSKQAQQIKALVDQGVDAIVVCAVDMNAIQSSLDYAASKGVIVTLYDRFVDNPNVKFTGGYNSYTDGQMAGKVIASFDDGQPHTVFELVGNLADTNALARRDGFHSVIDSHENLEVVQILTDWDVNKALTGVENALQKHPDVWAIYNASGHMGGSIKTALEEAGKLKKVGEPGHVYWTSIGEEPPAPQIAKEGYVDAILPIPMDQIGAAIYDAIKKLAAGEKLMSSKFYAETYQINAADIEKAYNDIWSVKYADVMGQ
jgi:ABC-type sugar transport system substrate-binding protein